MSLRIKDVLIKETGAKRMFPGQRHSLDTTERPTIDYGRDGATWEQSGETDAPKGHRSLKERCNQLKQYEVAYTSVMVFMIHQSNDMQDFW